MAQVFVSWSGERSKLVAVELTRWLPKVLQELKEEVWMSEHDISAGARWNHELAEQLSNTNFGVLCLTPENLGSPWLIFEAGALSKAIKEARVAPFRLDLRDADVGPPLSQFQGVDSDEAGTLRLVTSIHEAINSGLEKQQVYETFRAFWPQLQEKLSRISGNVPPTIRSEREILEELLDLMRRTGSRELETSLLAIINLSNVHSISVMGRQRPGEPMEGIILKVRVHRKIPLDELPEHEVIPSSVYGMMTDVIEVP
jgi:hypothetical protein